jgi:Lar family restriction alleviation protein
MTTEKLKPCPFCGSAAELIERPYHARPEYYVMCIAFGCGAAIPSGSNKQFVIEDWNRRADLNNEKTKCTCGLCGDEK